MIFDELFIKKIIEIFTDTWFKIDILKNSDIVNKST